MADRFQQAVADLHTATDWTTRPGGQPDAGTRAANTRWLRHVDACLAEGMCPFCGTQLQDDDPRGPRCTVHGSWRDDGSGRPGHWQPVLH